MRPWLMPLLILLSGAAVARLRLLSPAGSSLMSLMALLIWLAGGFDWLLLPLFFFLTASLFTRWPGQSHSDRTRRARQVAANGAVALVGALVALAGLTSAGALLLAGSYAAATADTWATEWGGAFGGRPLSLRTLHRVRSGESGAISLVGSLASMGGAAAVAVLATQLRVLPAEALLAVFAGGLSGSLADSFAGAWLQARWHGERGEHYEEAGPGRQHSRGLPWLDNDVVNLLATLVGGLVTLLLAS